MRRLTVPLVTLILLVLGAGPAAADPAGPTSYRSTITGMSGDVAAVDIEILGGDAFLVVRADAGTEVEVPGYEGEPYVRIAADGVVEVNERSPARWLNDAKLGAVEVDVPPQADHEAPPVWRVVADDGTYAWHDHRIHWMSPSVPGQVDTGLGEAQPVMDWEVPVLVDGEQAVIDGELHWVPGPAPALAVALVTLALIAGLLLVVVRGLPAPVLAAVGGVLALGTGTLPALGLPSGADADPALIAVPGLVLLMAGLGLWLTSRDPGAARGRLIGAAAGLPLLVWGVLQAGALVRPIVPGPIPVEGVRAVAALALGLGGACAVVLVRDLLRSAPAPLDDLDDEPGPASRATEG